MSSVNSKVFVCGSTEGGRLGIPPGTGNNGEKQDFPLLLYTIPVKSYEYITEVVCGFKSTYFLSNLGRVFVCGKGSDCLGLGHDKDVHIPTLITGFDGYEIIAVSSILSHSIALSKCGTVFTWGVGWNRRLGHGTYETHNIPKPVQFFKNKKPKHVCVGARFTLIATENNKLYGCGERIYLGLNGDGDTLLPEEISAFSGVPIKKMLATDHICILTTTGRVCCWGFNKHGECGVGSTLPWIRTPTWLNLNFPVVDIAIGYNHTVLLTGTGLVYGCGSNKYSQLGGVSGSKPVKISSLEKYRIIRVAVSGFHSLFVCDDRSVIAFGGNGKGQLGIPYCHDIPKPTQVKLNVKVDKLSCGYSHTAFVEWRGEPILKAFNFKKSELVYDCRIFYQM